MYRHPEISHRMLSLEDWEDKKDSKPLACKLKSFISYARRKYLGRIFVIQFRIPPTLALEL